MLKVMPLSSIKSHHSSEFVKLYPFSIIFYEIQISALEGRISHQFSKLIFLFFFTLSHILSNIHHTCTSSKIKYLI